MMEEARMIVSEALGREGLEGGREDRNRED